MPHSFAYLFERFPSFVQTFVYREAVEMVRQGMAPWLVSIRRPDDPGALAEHLDVEVFYAREGKELRGAKFVVTETDYARLWMEEKYPRACGKIFRVFNGIATDGFPPRKLADGLPRILSVGRYVEKKGFADLIEACRLLRDRGLSFAC